MGYQRHVQHHGSITPAKYAALKARKQQEKIEERVSKKKAKELKDLEKAAKTKEKTDKIEKRKEAQDAKVPLKLKTKGKDQEKDKEPNVEPSTAASVKAAAADTEDSAKPCMPPVGEPAQPINYKGCRIYTAVKDKSWRVLPFGARNDKKFKWGERPDSTWELLLTHCECVSAERM